MLGFRYSQLNPLCFSLAYSGILVWKSTHQQQPTKYEVVSERDSCHSCLREYLAAHTENSKKEGEGNNTRKIRRETITWPVFHHLSQSIFFQSTELMTQSQRRVVRRERTLLNLWNSRLRIPNTLLPCCWSHLTKLLYTSEGLWYCTHIHGLGPLLKYRNAG